MCQASYWVLDLQDTDEPQTLTNRSSWLRDLVARMNMYTHVCMLVNMNDHISHQTSSCINDVRVLFKVQWEDPKGF